METRLQRTVYEIFKTLNNLNPVFMKDILHYLPNATHEKHNHPYSDNKKAWKLEFTLRCLINGREDWRFDFC